MKMKMKNDTGLGGRVVKRIVQTGEPVNRSGRTSILKMGSIDCLGPSKLI